MEPDAESLHLILLLAVPTAKVLIGVFAIILMLLASGFVSGSEVAFFSLSLNDLEKLEQDNTRGSKRILRLKDKPRSLLATILILNNFINIGIVIISDFVLKNILPETLFATWAKQFIDLMPIFSGYSPVYMANVIGFLITVVGVTFLLVLFGEVAPKVYANLNNVRLATLTSGPLLFFMRILSPLTSILVSWTNIIERRLATSQSGSFASREEIDEAIELTVSNDEDTEQEVDILKSIVKFGDVAVKQIMRSRVDVIAVDFRISFSELLNVVKESGYSRIPVYDNDFDNVVGILYAKDLLGHLNEADDFEWQDLVRSNILYVPEAKKIDALLKDIQTERMHMAIVVDEYGGSSGIVTLEDIMEEIIGDIKDEFDDEEEVDYKKIDDLNYIFEGKTLLNDVCRIIGWDTNTFDEVRGEADSLAGLMLELIGQMPKKDMEINYNQFRFKIVSVSKRRIIQILVTLPK